MLSVLFIICNSPDPGPLPVGWKPYEKGKIFPAGPKFPTSEPEDGGGSLNVGAMGGGVVQIKGGQRKLEAKNCTYKKRRSGPKRDGHIWQDFRQITVGKNQPTGQESKS